MAQIGFVGLGKMGGRVAKRLLDAGYTVTGYNRTPSKVQWLLEGGMQWGASPRQVAETAEVTFSMVTDTAALSAILNGDDGLLEGLSPGKIYIDMSTVSASTSRETAEQVSARGAHMLDAPISGNVRQVEEGAASVMVGGDHAIFEQVQPILAAITPKVSYVGGNGQALLMKIAINLSLPLQFLGLCEGVLLAEKNGIPRERAIEVWQMSALASPATWHRAPFILNKPDEVWFDVDMMQKDLLLALELGRASEVPLLSVALSNQLLTAARAMGLGQEDFAALFVVLAQMAGVKQV